MSLHQRYMEKGPMRRGKQNTDPLRKIMERFQDENGVARERLECGHTPHVREDIIGPTNAYRRRCRLCGKANNG